MWVRHLCISACVGVCWKEEKNSFHPFLPLAYSKTYVLIALCSLSLSRYIFIYENMILFFLFTCSIIIVMKSWYSLYSWNFSSQSNWTKGSCTQDCASFVRRQCRHDQAGQRRWSKKCSFIYPSVSLSIYIFLFLCLYMYLFISNHSILPFSSLFFFFLYPPNPSPFSWQLLKLLRISGSETQIRHCLAIVRLKICPYEQQEAYSREISAILHCTSFFTSINEMKCR